ncbi:hypothetical protein Tco_0711714 [Tanacetum coccineum]
MAYNTREDLKGLQKDDMIKAIETRMIALQLHLQAMKGVLAFINLCKRKEREFEQETRDLDMENEQNKKPNASYGVTSPQELRPNQD